MWLTSSEHSPLSELSSSWEGLQLGHCHSSSGTCRVYIRGGRWRGLEALPLIFWDLQGNVADNYYDWATTTIDYTLWRRGLSHSVTYVAYVAYGTYQQLLLIFYTPPATHPLYLMKGRPQTAAVVACVTYVTYQQLLLIPLLLTGFAFLKQKILVDMISGHD